MGLLASSLCAYAAVCVVIIEEKQSAIPACYDELIFNHGLLSIFFRADAPVPQSGNDLLFFVFWLFFLLETLDLLAVFNVNASCTSFLIAHEKLAHTLIHADTGDL
jgi:hypothetical protein